VSDQHATGAPKHEAAPLSLAGAERDAHLRAALRDFDWSLCSIGPPELWPDSARLALDLISRASLPMMLWVGSELRVIYNSVAAPIFESRTSGASRALGAPAPEVFRSLWSEIAPVLYDDSAGATSCCTGDLEFLMAHEGAIREAYYRLVCMPLGLSSTPAPGVLVSLVETTADVLGRRRARCLHELRAALVHARTPAEIAETALRVLEKFPRDLAFSCVYREDDEACFSLRSGPPILGESAHLWPLLEVCQAERDVSIELTRFPAIEFPGGDWPQAAREARLLPLQTEPESARAVLVCGLSPGSTLDEAYRSFLSGVRDQLSVCILHAERCQVEHQRANLLEERDRARARFEHSLGQVLRAPLTLVSNPLEELLGHPNAVSELARHNLEIARRSAAHLARLVDGLLDFSRSEAGGWCASPRKLDLGSRTRELAEFVRPAIEAAGLAFRVDCAELITAWVDIEMWEKIVLHLLSNALNHTLQGSISVRLRRRGAWVELLVEDSGSGIASEHRPHVFAPFHRIEPHSSRTSVGLGIGLSLVRELARLHGGSVTCTSELGRGSSFCVRVPVVRRNSEQAPATEPESLHAPSASVRTFLRDVEGANGVDRAARATGADLVTLHREGDVVPRMLLYSDDRDLRVYLARCLQSDFEVCAVASPEAALERAREHVLDVVLWDEGQRSDPLLATLERLEADPALERVPIVVLTARADFATCAPAIEAYLIKPFTMAELMALVAGAVARKKGREQLRLVRESRELKRSNLDLEAFARGVSYDLRTNLRGIANLAQLIEQDACASMSLQSLDDLRSIQRRATRLDEWVASLLDYSCVASSEAAPETVDLAVLVGEVARDLELTSAFEIAIPRRLPCLCGARFPLRLVLGILMGQLVRQHANGSGCIEIAHVDLGDRIELQLKDDAAGIDRLLRQGFDRSHATPSDLAPLAPSTSNAAGSADPRIGLSIVERILAAHGGELELQAHSREGGSFVFSWPKGTATVAS